MTIPGFQDVMLPVLRAVIVGDEFRTGDLVRRMEEVFQLAPQERETLLPSGTQSIIANRTHWAITYLAKTGLLERTRRGYVRITARGRSVLEEQPDRIDLEYLARFPELNAFRTAKRNGSVSDEADPAVSLEETDATPDELIRSAHARIDAALRELLLSRILKSPPAYFSSALLLNYWWQWVSVAGWTLPQKRLVEAVTTVSTAS